MLKPCVVRGLVLLIVAQAVALGLFGLRAGDNLSTLSDTQEQLRAARVTIAGNQATIANNYAAIQLLQRQVTDLVEELHADRPAAVR